MTAFLLGSVPFVLVAFCWLCARKASYHHGKEEAFREVANDFQGLATCTWWKDRDKQAAERKRLMLRLCLCDPRVCEALGEALKDAREHWKHPAVAE